MSSSSRQLRLPVPASLALGGLLVLGSAGCGEDAASLELETDTPPPATASTGGTPDIGPPAIVRPAANTVATGLGELPSDLARWDHAAGQVPAGSTLDPALPPGAIRPGARYERGQLRTTFGGWSTDENVAENLHRGGRFSFSFEGVRIVDGDGVEQRFVAARSVAGVDEGGFVRFADVVPGADLTFLPKVHRLQQLLVLYGVEGLLEPDQTDFALEIVERIAVPEHYQLLHVFGERRDLHELPLELEARGELVFVTEDPESGERRSRFTIPAPAAIEDPSALASAAQAPQRFRLAQYVRLGADGQGELATRIEAAELLDANTVFPVFVDPDLVLREGVTISSMQLAPTRSQSCDTVFAGVYGNFTNKQLNVFTEWSDGPSEAKVSRLQEYQVRSFDTGACPGDYELTFRVCDDKVPAECDEVTLPVQPGGSTGRPENDCDFRCRDGVAFSFSAKDTTQCVRRMASVCADNGGRLEVSPECSPLVIDEVRFGDDAGETGFVELVGPPGMSLEGWFLEQRSGATGEVASGEAGWAALRGNVGIDGLYTVCAPGADYFGARLTGADAIPEYSGTQSGSCRLRVLPGADASGGDVEVFCTHDAADVTDAFLEIETDGGALEQVDLGDPSDPIAGVFAVSSEAYAVLANKTGRAYFDFDIADGATIARGEAVAACDATHELAALAGGGGDGLVLRNYGLRRDAVQYGGPAAVDTRVGEGRLPGVGLVGALSRDLRGTDRNDNRADFALGPPLPGTRPSCAPMELGDIPRAFTARQGNGCTTSLEGLRAFETAGSAGAAYASGPDGYGGEALVPSASDEAMLFLHADDTNGIVSLALVLDSAGDGTGGQASVRFDETRGTLGVAVSDDGGELSGVEGVAVGEFAWEGAETDGGVVSNIRWVAGACVVVTPAFVSGIDSFVFVTDNGDGTQSRQPLSLDEPVEICADLCAGARVP